MLVTYVYTLDFTNIKIKKKHTNKTKSERISFSRINKCNELLCVVQKHILLKMCIMGKKKSMLDFQNVRITDFIYRYTQSASQLASHPFRHNTGLVDFSHCFWCMLQRSCSLLFRYVVYVFFFSSLIRTSVSLGSKKSKTKGE